MSAQRLSFAHCSTPLVRDFAVGEDRICFTRSRTKAALFLCSVARDCSPHLNVWWRRCSDVHQCAMCFSRWVPHPPLAPFFKTDAVRSRLARVVMCWRELRNLFVAHCNSDSGAPGGKTMDRGVRLHPARAKATLLQGTITPDVWKKTKGTSTISLWGKDNQMNVFL